MKKILSLIICSFLLISVCLFSVSADESVLTDGSMSTDGALSGKSEIKVGETADYIVKISDCPDVSSASVNITLPNGMSIVSGSWIKSGSISAFDTEKLKGVISALSSPDINGELFTFTVKCDAKLNSNAQISVTVSAKNGTQDVFNKTYEKPLQTPDSENDNKESQTEKEGIAQKSDSEGNKTAKAPTNSSKHLLIIIVAVILAAVGVVTFKLIKKSKR